MDEVSDEGGVVEHLFGGDRMGAAIVVGQGLQHGTQGGDVGGGEGADHDVSAISAQRGSNGMLELGSKQS